MRKLLSLCLLLAFFSCPALAQEPLPQGVAALCSARHPGYAISTYDGWGDESQGQYALVLSRDGDNILCIAEKAQSDAAYAFTVDNTHAVREGDQIPSLLIDTGGDSLFYSYWDDDLYKTGYHTLKQDGEWGRVSIQYIDTSYVSYDVDTIVGVDGLMLFYDVDSYDKLENPTDDFDAEYMDIPVSPEFAEKLKLATFDIDMLSPNPAFIKPYEGLCDGLIEEGDALRALDLGENTLVMIVKKPDGTKRLRVCDGWDEYKNDYVVIESQPLPDDAALDTYHARDGQILLYTDQFGTCISFSRAAPGLWFPGVVQGDGVFALGYDCADELSVSNWCRNDGAVYGDAPWSVDLTALNIKAIPLTFSDAVSLLDQSSYAVVNNPNPEDRLHIREAPNRSAASLGKFYNRTPVEILSRENGWAHVRLGRGLYSFTGYMMDKYLAFGEDMASVACVFPQLTPVGDDGALVDVHLGADKKTEVIAQVASGGYYIAGVHGDDWLIIMTRDGVIGYALRSDFWEGNG